MNISGHSGGSCRRRQVREGIFFYEGESVVDVEGRVPWRRSGLR